MRLLLNNIGEKIIEKPEVFKLFWIKNHYI